MKKIFTLVLLSMIAFNAIHADIIWNLSDDGTLTISGTDMPDYEYEENYGPHGSGDYWVNTPWYSQRAKIKNVVIENGVTRIGRYAFYECSYITSITIPNSVTSIEYDAFYGCI